MQFFRMNDITKTSSNHTFILTARDVINKLKQRMTQHDTAIRKTFLKYSKSGKGRVTKKDLKMVRVQLKNLPVLENVAKVNT